MTRMKACGEYARHKHDPVASYRKCVRCGVLGKDAPVDVRFWNKVDRSGGSNACWIWKGAVTTHGYGEFLWKGKVKRAHQVSWGITNGPVNFSRFNNPESLCICHHCDTPLCVNPAHLFIGKLKDNHDDMRRKGRGCGKLNATQVREIRRRRAAGERQDHLAAAFSVGRQTIHRVTTGISWNYVQQEG